MSNSEVTFGWVTQPAARNFPDEVMQNPTTAGKALMEANETFIRAMQPHFDTVWVEDHFQWDDLPTLEAFTTLAYLAGRHESVRFGHIVLGQSYRNAALTAKMAANMQLMTGGRFILGIGAGWKEDEYRAYGYPYPSDGQRIDELEDAAQIIRAMWTDSPASFQGKYYNIDRAYCEPRPDPAIPLLIAGGGEKKTLRVVAKYADWWNFNFCTAEVFAHKQKVLAEHCREVGRDPGEIVHTFYAPVSVSNDPDKVKFREEFHVVGGNPDAVAKELQSFIDLGVKHIQLRFNDFPHTDGLELFISQVLPKLER